MSDQRISRRSLNALALSITLVTLLMGLAALIFVLLSTNETPETPITSIDDPDSITVDRADSALAGTSIEPPRPLTDFTMPANTGEDLSLSDMEGHYVLLYFGYTRCPDACPATLLKFRRIKQALGDDAENMRFLFISVDGERDTPPDLDRYIQRYDPAFIALSGTDDTLAPIQSEFGLFYEKRENPGTDAGYLVDHTSSTFLIDPEGRLIRLYSFIESAQAITQDLQSLLQPS